MNTFTNAMTDAALAGALFQRIESRRKAMKMTQLALSEQVGITPKTYRTLKTGSCSVMVLIGVLRELEMLANLDNLVPDPGTRPAEIWNQLSPNNRRRQSTVSQISQIRNMKEQRKKLKQGDDN